MTKWYKESLAIQVQNSDLEYIYKKSCLVINEFFKEYTEPILKYIGKIYN